MPDANTLWDFREALSAAEVLFARLDRAITGAGYRSMSGQIVDATLVSVPRQCNTDAAKAGDQRGQNGRGNLARQVCQGPAGERRCALGGQVLQGRSAADGKPQIDFAFPTFSYKCHISIDRRHGVIGRSEVTGAAAPGDARLRKGLIDPNNTAFDVRAESACRAAENERFLASIGKLSRIHHRKRKGKPMLKRTTKANAARSAIRAMSSTPSPGRTGR